MGVILSLSLDCLEACNASSYKIFIIQIDRLIWLNYSLYMGVFRNTLVEGGCWLGNWNCGCQNCLTPLHWANNFRRRPHIPSHINFVYFCFYCRNTPCWLSCSLCYLAPSVPLKPWIMALEWHHPWDGCHGSDSVAILTVQQIQRTVSGKKIYPEWNKSILVLIKGKL